MKKLKIDSGNIISKITEKISTSMSKVADEYFKIGIKHQRERIKHLIHTEYHGGITEKELLDIIEKS